MKTDHTILLPFWTRAMMACLLLLSASSLFAQEFKVKEFTHQPNNLRARTYERLDLNDVPCAIIRFVAPDIMSYTFEGNICGGIEYSPGEAIIYLPENTRDITIKNNKFGVLRYTFPVSIQRHAVYELLMDVPNRVTIPAGTMVRLKSLQEVRGKKAHVGDVVDFAVAHDLMMDNQVVVKKGTLAKGTVTKAKSSKWFGTRGYLTIQVDSLCLPNGRSVELFDSKVELKGKRRGWVPYVWIFTWYFPPTAFISGTKAVMPKGYTFKGLLGDNITVDM